MSSVDSIILCVCVFKSIKTAEYTATVSIAKITINCMLEWQK